MSLRIGITGGIGSGKSVVARLLRVAGLPVYDCDAEARRLMLVDADIRHELTALLGADAYADGRLNKPFIAAYLFASPDNAARINGIVHPRVREDFRRWAAQQAEPLVGLESAILLEAGFQTEVDKVVVVCAPAELRVRRIISRDHTDRQQAMRRMSGQMDEEEKRRRADFLVVNDGRHSVIGQVASLLESLGMPVYQLPDMG